MIFSKESKVIFSALLMLGLIALLGYVCYALQYIVMPFVVGMILAYFLNPFANQLSRYVPRILASLVIVVGVLVVAFLFIAFLVPMLIEQIEELSNKTGVIFVWLQDNSQHIHLPAFLRQLDNLNNGEWLSAHNIKQLWQANSATLNSFLLHISNYAKQTGSSLLYFFYVIFMLPITVFYFICVWPDLVNRVDTLIPRRYHEEFAQFVQELHTALTGFIRGQFLVMLVMGLIYGLGLTVVNLKNGFAIGFITGFLVFIPYFGFIVGSLLATLAAILQYGDLWHIAGVWVVFLIGQMLESFVVTPRLVGSRIGLSPFLVIFSLLAFAKLFGFLGMLMALPLSAVSAVIVRILIQKYYQSDFYRY
jgi:putative transmembrane protein